MASQVEVDPQETREWLEALDAVVASDGPQRAQFLLERVVGHAQLTGAAPAPAGTTPYLNTIPPQDEPPHPVDEALERRVRSIVRWNAIATILNANKTSLRARRPHRQLPVARRSSTRPASTTSGTRRRDAHGGDLVFMQGHSSPGVYARAFLEGRHHRGADAQASAWRSAAAGSARYPHPWLMPDFWQFPTVSHGPRPADGDLPGALHEVPAGPRPGRDRRPQGVGLHGRRRDGRARVAGRDLDGRPRAPRQPDLRHQLQPAAPRRPGARQRQDHPGARDQLPRRGLERHQGDLGLALGPAPRAPTTRATCSRA